MRLLFGNLGENIGIFFYQAASVRAADEARDDTMSEAGDALVDALVAAEEDLPVGVNSWTEAADSAAAAIAGSFGGRRWRCFHHQHDF